MGTRDEYTRSVKHSQQRMNPLLPGATSMINALAGIADRMPAAHEQNPEVERRRMQDIYRDLQEIVTVNISMIRQLEDAGFMSDELELFIKEVHEEDDPYLPCMNPKNLVEWLRCWQSKWGQLIRCCIENNDRWGMWWHEQAMVNERITQEGLATSERFINVEENSGGRWLPTATRDLLTGINVGDNVMTHEVKSDRLAWEPIPKTASFVVLSETKKFYPCDANSGVIVVTLPNIAATQGYEYKIKKMDSSTNYLRLTPNGVQTIEGDPTLDIQWKGDAVHITNDAVSDWSVT